jgi:murein DD-endopeptidase MepM/ murein hydrolase activator NlpD
VLPYQVGSAYRVIQGNCGSFSHLPSGPWRYAFDFDMPIGTPIVAVRAGTVIEVREQFVDGNRITGQENLIWVRHADNSIGRYLHLTQNGALVWPGDEVAQGTVIGLSGDTGFSTQPHLHFDVAACGGPDCETMPVVFRNTEPNPQGLVRGISYLAQSY